MKLYFEPNLDYQHAAIESVCDPFRGQEICRTEFRAHQFRTSSGETYLVTSPQRRGRKAAWHTAARRVEAHLGSASQSRELWFLAKPRPRNRRRGDESVSPEGPEFSYLTPEMGVCA